MARRKRHRKARPAPERPEARSGDAPRQGESAAERWRPSLLGGLVALFVLRPLFPSEGAAREGDGLVVVMLWIALAVLWLLAAIGRRQFHVRFGWTDGAVLLLVGWHTIAALWATTQGSPRPAINMLWEWVAYGLCFFLARQLIVTRREARAVIAVMIGLAVALGGYGVYQYSCETPARWAEYEDDPDAMLKKNHLWLEPGSRERQLFENRLYSREPTATFALTNSLAGYLAPWLVVLAGVGISGWGVRGASFRSSWGAMGRTMPLGALLLLTLLLTKSRSGWLATLLGVVLLVVWLVRSLYRKRKAATGWHRSAVVLSAAIVLAVMLVVVACSLLDVRILSEAPKSLGYRLQYWRSTGGMIADYPIAGCGPGNFRHAYTAYMLPEASEEIAEPHNFLMEVWATAGTPAMLALLAVLGCFAHALSRRRVDVAGQQRPNACAAAGAIGAVGCVFAGAACGFLLSVPIGQMSAGAPSVVGVVAGVRCPVVVLLGLPLAIVAVILLWRWIDEGALPAAFAGIGVVVVLVNLLAAGGIGFPAVAGSLWLLIALGLNTGEAPGPRTLPRSAGVAALVFTMILAITCYATGYAPVLRCRAAMERGQVALYQGEWARAAKHFHDAAAADRLSDEPVRQLGLLAFERWLATRNPEAFDEFEACLKTALDLAPNAAPAWRMSGDRYLRAFGATGRKDTLQNAVRAYKRAVELYPNSAVNRANLAIALRAAGDRSGFREQAAMALHLDERTPHSDKKLDDAVRGELREGLSRSSSREGRRGILGGNGADSVGSPRSGR